MFCYDNYKITFRILINEISILNIFFFKLTFLNDIVLFEDLCNSYYCFLTRILIAIKGYQNTFKIM